MLETATSTPPPTDRSSAAKSAYAIVATFGCLACALFLIVATIVLALIPVYTSTSSATINTDSFSTKSADMVLALDDSSTRRRSLSANETAYTGAIAGAEGLSAVKSRFRSYILQYADDIVIEKAQIIQKTTTLQRRRRLSKRADLDGIALRIVYRIIFPRTCGFSCQLRNCASLKSFWEKTDFSTITLPAFFLTLSDGSIKTVTLKFGKTKKIGDLIPGTSSATPEEAGDDATVTTTIATTTIATTADGTTTDPALGATDNLAG